MKETRVEEEEEKTKAEKKEQTIKMKGKRNWKEEENWKEIFGNGKRTRRRKMNDRKFCRN